MITTVRRLNAPFKAEDNDQQILQHVIGYYHETLKQSPKAMDYLIKRGINTSDVIDHFKLGFSDRTLGYRLPEKNRKEGAALRGRLQRLGIIKSSGHELFRGSIVVPIIENNIIKQIYGRKVTQRLRPGTPSHCYLPGPKQGFFNIKAVQTCDEVILCPSIIDALTFWCAGYKNIICNYGLDQFVSEDIETLTVSAVKRILIAYAGTKAGDVAAQNLSDQLANLGIDCYRIEFPRELDANAYALKYQPAIDSLGEAIRKAVWLGKGEKSTSTEKDKITKIEPVRIISDANTDEVLSDKSTTEECVTTAEATETVIKHNDTTTANEADVLPARVLPPSCKDIDTEVKDDEIVMFLEDRRYRVRGLKKNLCFDQLKVNLLINKEESLHVDTFDMYASRPRLNFIKQAAIEIGVTEDVIKQDLGKILLKLELLQDQNIQQALTIQPQETEMTALEHAEAMDFLTSPQLLHRLLEDYQRCGIVGEKTNKLVGYLAALSRKLDKPLAVIIQSTSAAGKSALMEAVLSFVPEEERLQYSAITGQSLFYMGDINLKHKILSISEEEGASNATYALKLLQSEGQLTIASTGKDPNSGRHVVREYKVEGPVMIFSTTTAIDVDEELLNRCLILTVDEDRAQTRAIHENQRLEETLEGLQNSQIRDDILQVHRNAQRLIKPLKVINPYARYLTFLDDKTRTRRDHQKYLTLIRSITLLHQYQRETKKTYYRGKQISYIEVAFEDIDIANQLAHEILGRSLDELQPQTRRLLIFIDAMVTVRCDEMNLSRSDYHFSRRDVRAYTGWGDTQLKVHLQRLETMEYLLIHRGGRGRCIIYELLYNHEGKDGKPFLMGLVAIETLRKHIENEKQSGLKNNLSGSSRPLVGMSAGVSQTFKDTANLLNNNGLAEKSDDPSLKTLIEKNIQQTSYRTHTPLITKGGISNES